MKLRSDLLLLLGTTLASLLGAELLLRAMNLGFNNVPLNPSDTSHHVHPENFQFTAYSPSGEWDNFIVRTDQYGNRIVPSSCDPAPSSQQHSLYLLGDSFIEGFQVDDSHSIAGMIEKKLCKRGYQVQNLGVSSYSPILSYVHFKRYLKRSGTTSLKGSTVVQVLYDNDVDGDNEYAKLARLQSDGSVTVPSHDSLSPLQQLSRYSYIARLVRRAQLTLEELGNKNIRMDAGAAQVSKEDSHSSCPVDGKNLKTTRQYLEKTSQLVNSLGGVYILSAIPANRTRFRGSPYPCYREIASDLGITFIDAPQGLWSAPASYYFRKDIHLNPSGYKLVADNLIQHITPSLQQVHP